MSVAMPKEAVAGVEIRGAWGPRYDEVLNPETLGFLADLQRKFNPSRLRLLKRREERQARFDAGELPDFPAGDAARSARATGRSRRSPPTCSTVASRSPARSTGR